MRPRFHRALSRLVPILVAVALSAGCYDPRKDKALNQITFGAGALPAGPRDLGDADKDGKISYETPTFELREDRKIGDVTVSKGQRVEALFVDGRLVLPPEFEWIKIWRSDFAYAKRHQSKAVLRIDTATKKEEIMPFTSLEGARTGRYGKGRPIGVIDEGGDLLKVALLASDGRVAKVIERVERRSFTEGPQPVDGLEGGGYIAHHVGDKGEKLDVIYNATGVPISPQLTPVLRLIPKDAFDKLGFAIKTDPDRDLYWPIRDDGTLYPKPKDLVGLRPVYTPDYDRLWCAWVAVWSTDAGERSAFLWKTNDPEKILETRGKAVHEDIAYTYYKATHASERDFTLEAFIIKSPGAPGYIIQSGDKLLSKRFFATVDEARTFLKNMDDATNARNRALEAQEYEAYQARKAAAERLAEEKRKKAYDEQKTNEAKVDKLIAEKKYAEARDLAWKTTPSAIRRAVLAAVRADQMAHLTSFDLSEGLLAASGAEAEKIRTALQSVQSREFSGSSGSSSGVSSGSPSSPSSSYKQGPSVNAAIQATIDNARWQSQLNYLSGQQSWGYSDNGRVRR